MHVSHTAPGSVLQRNRLGSSSTQLLLIRGADIAKADPLCIEANPEVLQTKVVYVTSPADQFDIQTTGNSICVTFEYLDKNQGGIIQLIRSGNLDGNINLRGSIMGSAPIVARGLTQRRDRAAAFLIGIAIGALMAVLSVYLIGLAVPDPLAIGLGLFLAFLLFVIVVMRIPTVPSKFGSVKRVV